MRIPARLLGSVAVAALLASPCVLAQAGGGDARPPDATAQRLSRVGPLVAAAIAEHRLPGAVVAVGRPNGIVYARAFGERALVPAPEAMTTDTIFDIASLTKVVATTTSVMMLLEQLLKRRALLTRGEIHQQSIRFSERWRIDAARPRARHEVFAFALVRLPQHHFVRAHSRGQQPENPHDHCTIIALGLLRDGHLVRTKRVAQRARINTAAIAHSTHRPRATHRRRRRRRRRHREQLAQPIPPPPRSNCYQRDDESGGHS
jgi:hypothetical protein